MKKPKKSRNIFFAYVHNAKKNGMQILFKKYVWNVFTFIILLGPHSNARLCVELIITKKTEHIPNGTVIHLMVI